MNMNILELQQLSADRRVILPIDTADLAAGLALASRVRHLIWGVKLGHIPLAEHGAVIIRRFLDLGVEVGAEINVMADPKLMDIPNTVSGAAVVYRSYGASLCTMHASMGKTAMKAVVKACRGETLSLAVTVLTSMGDEDCEEVYGAKPDVVVPRLANLALEKGGADGIVCSPADLIGLRETVRDFDSRLFVTPGVRPAGSDTDDQARVATPGQAIRNGATLLVIGRAISKASDPLAATERIVVEIDEALS